MSGSFSSGAPQAIGSSPLASPSSSVGLSSSPQVDFANDFKNSVDSVNSIISTAIQNDVGKAQVNKMVSEYKHNLALAAAQDIQNKVDMMTYVDNSGQKIPNPDFVQGDDSGQPYLTVKQAREMKLSQFSDDNVEWLNKQIVKSDYDTAEVMQRINQLDKINPTLAAIYRQTFNNLSATYDQLNALTSWYNEQTTDIRDTRPYRISQMLADTHNKDALTNLYFSNKREIDTLLNNGYFDQMTHLLMNNNRLSNVQGSQAIFYFNRAKSFLKSDVGSAMDYFKKGYDCLGPLISDGIKLMGNFRGTPQSTTYQTGPRYQYFNNY